MGRRGKKKGRPISGWVVLDKPVGMGSTEAVSKVKWLFQAEKAGHAGTLDPLASGVLPVALGEATKQVVIRFRDVPHLPRGLNGREGPVELRRMFGGQGLYHQDIIIGLIIGEALFLKTDEETRPRFEAGGGAPFIYTGKGKPVRTSYWSPPAEAFESAEDMLPWARLAWAAALRAAARKPAKRKRSLGDVRL